MKPDDHKRSMLVDVLHHALKVCGLHPFLPSRDNVQDLMHFKYLMSQKSRCVSVKVSRIHVLGADVVAMKMI